jgi:hypothetical protein
MTQETTPPIPSAAALREAMGQAGVALVKREEELDVGDSPFPDDVAQAAVLGFLRTLGWDALADAAKEAGRGII